MSPQFALLLYLAILVAGGLYKIAVSENDPAKACGGAAGLIARYATIAGIAWWGGFFSGGGQ